MSTREILFILILIFTAGFISSQVVGTKLPVSAISFMAMVGGLLGVMFNRIKHLDDLKLTRKKDISLNFIKFMSEYRTALISITDQNIKPEEFHSNLMNSTKNMIAALDQFHVVANDEVSAEIELKNFELVSLMVKMNKKSQETGDNKIELMKWLLEEDLLSQLNIIRYQIIKLVNSEIGDNSGTEKLKESINKNNKDFKELLSRILNTASSTA